MKTTLLFSLVLTVLITIFFSVFFILQVQKNTFNKNSLKSDTTMNQTGKVEKRIWQEIASDRIIYQIPLTVLSVSSVENSLYRLLVSPYNSPQEEFYAVLGPQHSLISYGECVFSKEGQITGNAAWALRDLDDIAETFQVGDELLAQVYVPKTPKADQLQYKIETEKLIHTLENKNTIDELYPTTLCKLKK